MADTASYRRDNPRGRIQAGKLIAQLGLLLSLLFLGILLLGAHFRTETVEWSRQFIEAVGGPGIFIAVLLPDAFPIPLPQDAFLTFGLIGGLGLGRTMAWGGAGSITGACIGFWVGRWLATTRLYEIFTERVGSNGHEVVERYGMVGLGLSAITPIPFGACCWAVGALGMPFRSFLIAVQARWLHIGVHLWLIEVGFQGPT